MITADKRPTVLVFGVFDRLHAGHLYFLRQAAKYGKVTAVVARDSSVQKLKNKNPRQNEKGRLKELKKTTFVHRAVFGDKKIGEYQILKKIKPDIICLGYDQKSLKKDLKRFFAETRQRVKIVKIKAFKPDNLHTSLLEIS